MDDKIIFLVENGADGEELTVRVLRSNGILKEVVVSRDGAGVLRRLRATERTGRLPATILTSSGDRQDIIDSYGSHPKAYGRKPKDVFRFGETSGGWPHARLHRTNLHQPREGFR